MKLIENGSATSGSFLWAGGSGVFNAVGTFGGATVALQYLSADGVTWNDFGPSTTLTATGGGVFTWSSGQIRCRVTSGTPSGIYANAEQVK